MKYNLKLNKDEKSFAVKHITEYYRFNTKCKYSGLINSILEDFEKNMIDYNQLKTDNNSENTIIKKLLSVFIDKLNYEKENNPTGLFGVKRAFFTDSTNLFYKDLIKDEFVKSYPIYAHNLKELKTKVKSNKGVWVVFDGKKYGEFTFNLTKRTEKSNRKISKGYPASKKSGYSRSIMMNGNLIASINNSYGKH